MTTITNPFTTTNAFTTSDAVTPRLCAAVGTTTHCDPSAGRPAPARSGVIGADPSSRRGTIPERVRAVALSIWRLLPSAGSSTPSDDAIASLSPGDRLGERR